MTASLEGIAPDAWEVSVLPHPKRFSRSKALGFCGDAPVGVAETARAKVAACWWPGGAPALLALEGYKEVRALFARGDVIPGSWIKGSGGTTGAIAWRLAAGEPAGRSLHDGRFDRTWAVGAGGGLVVGAGVHKGKPGARPRDPGLVWNAAGELREITAERDVCLRATDGTAVAGSIAERAALWPSLDAPPVDLTPADMSAAEVDAIDGDTQVGYAFRKFVARAMLWRGSAASAVDLTPSGFAESRAFAAAGGYQAGQVRKRSTTRDGSGACDDHAALWHGTPERWIDLNALLPEPFNASTAWGIAIDGDRLRVCGEARRVETSNPGTPREAHYVPLAQAVVWTARLAAPSARA